ncbi:uncharacterized protein Bfra_009956 [Botrytis fragariae]|uniref:Uncharacterized protein n=1 Tax=Botrytis fragariae TaxID=1964551 RepID=A0A8H6AN68_9HELO|nr:uncharacterized protein Bfra_009956 [Botrytis fragariae]KAF5870567.1 hypothetical protein Bfra_009956 [Botrytis fragariae]
MDPVYHCTDFQILLPLPNLTILFSHWSIFGFQIHKSNI